MKKEKDEKSGELKKILLLKTWSTDRGYFQAGTVIELAEELAASLIAEGSAEAQE
jgi:hypothetical protein